jgi:hypothetical protein
MRRPAKSLSLPAAIIVVAFLAAGCGNTASSVLGNLPTPTRTATTTGRPTTPDSPADSTTPPPTTAPPTTAPPTTTVPTTAAPTAAATVTVTATPSVTTATPSASATPGTGSGTKLLWLWILLGAAVLIGLIVWIVSASRRRSARAANWRSRLIDAYAKGSALHDAMSVAETLGAAGDVGARWADVQRRADDLTQTLYALREAAPDPADQDRISDVLVSLQTVRSAMDAERAPGGASPQQAQVVSDRLYSFELSLRALRGSDQGFT